MSSDAKAPAVETVIEATHGWRFLNWRELWAYRDLLRLLVQRDFVARYKQTVLGPLWHVFQPLFTTIVFTVVFSHVAELPTDGLPPPFSICADCSHGIISRRRSIRPRARSWRTQGYLEKYIFPV